MFGMLEFLAFIDDENERRLFEILYLSYRKQMHAVAKSILLNDADAEDAVHDAFLKLAKKHMPTISGIEDERDRRNYLLKMAKNTALNMKRDRKPVVDPNDPAVNAFAVRKAGIDDYTFINTLCDYIESKSVIEAINHLDPVYKDVLYYHFVLEMTIPQTAKALGRKEQTVKKQLVRGKKLLLDMLKTDGGETDVDD